MKTLSHGRAFLDNVKNLGELAVNHFSALVWGRRKEINPFAALGCAYLELTIFTPAQS